jgi:hypothetical protein
MMQTAALTLAADADDTRRETEQRQLLHLVETMQREGRSEREIVTAVEDAAGAGR